MTTTTQLRSWWAPACEGPFVKVALHGEGVVSVRPEIVDAVHALSACLEHHRYETRAADTGAYNCRRITGGTGYSLHAYGIALDLNWTTNPYGPVLVTDMPPAMVAAIKAIRTTTGKQVWRWGGDYAGNKDAMHFEITCHPADLATGIDPDTLPTTAPTEDDDDMKASLSWLPDPRTEAADAHLYLVHGTTATHVSGQDAINIARYRGAAPDGSTREKPHLAAFLKQVHILDGPLAGL